MRLHDSLIGGVLLLLSLAVLWHVQGFPPAAGQQYGPALFPGLVAGGLALARDPDKQSAGVLGVICLANVN